MTTPYGFQSFQAAVDISAAGNTTAVVAQTNHSIRVISMTLCSSNTQRVTIKRGSTTLLGPVDLDARQVWVLPLNEYGWFWTDHNEALVITTSHKHQLTGSINYFLAL